MTSGGDVTADEVTPLPPVIVESPAKPKRRKSSKKAAGVVTGTGATALADLEAKGELPGAAGVGIFTLGQLDMIGGSTITNEAMWTFNKNRLDEALSIVPGVTMQTLGGSRNERDLLVRGFDRFRVPLYMDGVRIYLPADNRLDYNRFLTPDLSEIQVQKGYVSVLDGPGGLGGAINMVSRKPTKAVEIEGRTGITLDGDLDSMGAWNAYAFAGTRQKGYYAQLSGNIVDQDHWSMSDDFTPVNLANEDGGDRNHSDISDWRINAKVGLTPNATDEYTINFTSQSGEKSAPLHVEGQTVAGGTRYWTWPYWDSQSVSWLSKTQLGTSSYVKTNVYYNTFKNLLKAYDDATYTSQAGGKSWDSWYDDYAYGGFVEMGANLIPMNTLKGAIHYRRDSHSERSLNSPDAAMPELEPWQESIVDTWSFAAENTFHAMRDLDIVAGISYDMEEVRKAEEFDAVITQSPAPSSQAWNGQVAAIYSLSPTGKVHASVSSRTRFPTLFDRYSTRFGTRDANPFLKPERATNYEIGWSDYLTRTLRVTTTVFYSDLKDSIQNVSYGTGGKSIVGINVDGEHYGVELSVEWAVMRGLHIGGNYTYLERDLDFASAASQAAAGQRAAVAAATEEGTPRHEAFIYLSWDATERLTLTPTLQLASDRSSLITSADSTLGSGYPNYARIGSYALVNFEAEYEVTENLTTSIGGTNLLDQNYELTDGFPEAGRQFYLKARAKF